VNAVLARVRAVAVQAPVALRSLATLARARRAYRWLASTGFLIAGPVIVIGLVMTWIWPGLPLPEDEKEAAGPGATLLSTAATFIASVLALVFTISLVVVQVSASYSHRMASRFVNTPTIAYISLAIAAILFPSWFLADPSPIPVKISFSLAILFLVFLVPYFFALKRWLDPETMLLSLKRDATQRMRSRPEQEPEEIGTIEDTVLSSFGMKDYGTFDIGVQALADFALEAYAGKRDAIGAAVLERIVNMGVIALEDPTAPIRVLKALTRAGVRASDERLGAAGEAVCSAVGEVGERAAEQGLGGTALWAADALREIGVRAADRKVAVIVWKAADSLREVGVPAADHALKSAAERAASCLGAVAAKAIDYDMEFAAWQAINALGAVGVHAAHHGVTAAVSRVESALASAGTAAAGKGLEEPAEECAAILWTLGAWATARPELGIGSKAREGIARMREGAAAMVESGYAKAERELNDPAALRGRELSGLLKVFRETVG